MLSKNSMDFTRRYRILMSLNNNKNDMFRLKWAEIVNNMINSFEKSNLKILEITEGKHKSRLRTYSSRDGIQEVDQELNLIESHR